MSSGFGILGRLSERISVDILRVLNETTRTLKTTDHSERVHSKISPSKLKSLEISPKFERWENEEVHPITAIGTKIHEARDRNSKVGLLDDEIPLYDFCEARDSQWEKVYRFIFKEKKLTMAPFTIWGFADRIQLNDVTKPTAGILIDYKFSTQMQEDCETNPAAQAYVLGMFNEWPTLQQVRVEYYYPRLGVVDAAVYTRKDLGKIKVRIAAIIRRVESPSVRCNMAEETCMYCKHIATCTEVTRQALPIATRYNERKQFVLPAQLDPAAVTDPKHMATLLAYSTVMSAWAESVKVHAKELRLNQGVEIPGYDLVPRQGKLSVQDVNSAYKMATQKYGVTHDEFLAATSVSIVDLVDAVKRNAPARAKGKAADAFRAELQDSGAAVQGQDSWTLVKTKDKGQ